MIKLIIPGEPVAKGRPRVTKSGIAFTPKKTRDYETIVREIYFMQHGQTMLEDELEIDLKLFFQIPKSVSKKRKESMLSGEERPQKRPDLDNCMKSILDALNQVAYADDKQITRATVEKHWSNIPRAELTIKKR